MTVINLNTIQKILNSQLGPTKKSQLQIYLSIICVKMFIVSPIFLFPRQGEHRASTELLLVHVPGDDLVLDDQLVQVQRGQDARELCLDIVLDLVQSVPVQQAVS